MHIIRCEHPLIKTRDRYTGWSKSKSTVYMENNMINNIRINDFMYSQQWNHFCPTLYVHYPPVMGQQGIGEHLVHNFAMLPVCATAKWSDRSVVLLRGLGHFKCRREGCATTPFQLGELAGLSGRSDARVNLLFIAWCLPLQERFLSSRECDWLRGTHYCEQIHGSHLWESQFSVLSYLPYFTIQLSSLNTSYTESRILYAVKK